MSALENTVPQQKPLLRGVSHLAASIGAALAAPVLILLSDSPQAYVGAAIFAASLILLYGTSASYHLVTWRPDVRSLIRRIDHSMIFVFIAGTYTPFCLVVIDLAWGISMLSVIWGIAGLGILIKLTLPTAPRWVSVSLYIALGWLSLITTRELVTEMETGPLMMLAGGGILYTLGGLIYALKRPDPLPRVMGYHEVFHLFVISGSAVHALLLAIYVLPT